MESPTVDQLSIKNEEKTASKHIESVSDSIEVVDVQKHQVTTNYNRLVTWLVAVGSLSYGYSAAIIGTTIGQAGWYEQFGLAASGEPGYSYTSQVLGIVNGLFSAGGFVGAIITIYLAEKFGRKPAIQMGGMCAMLGGALQTGAMNLATFYIGRFLAGVGVGILVTSIPLYVSECALPSRRGYMGHHAIFLVSGYFSSAWISYGTSFATNLSFAWRFPLSVQVLFPLILLIVSPLVPETPRWLLHAGKDQKAWNIVKRLHSTAEDEAAIAFAKDEFYQMFTHLALERKRSAALGSKWNVLKRPSYRKRFWVGFLTQFGAECAGPLVLNNYQVILYENLGLTGHLPLLLISIWLTTSVPYNIIGATYIDRIGRRPYLLVGMAASCIFTCCEAAMTAQYVGTTNKVGQGWGVAFIFLYLMFQGTLLDGSMYIYVSEIFPMEIRSLGVGISISGQFIGTLILLTTAPIGFNNVGWKYFLVMIACSFTYFWIIYFCFPETTGKTLEEIDVLFGEEIAVRLEDTSVEERERLEAWLLATEQGHIGNFADFCTSEKKEE